MEYKIQAALLKCPPTVPMEGVFVDSPPCVIVCMCLVLKLFCQFGAETFSWFKTQNNTDS